MIRLGIVCTVLIICVNAGPATEVSFRGQFCVDPRTMRKHAAYSEWADAYSCTRHRCQPGGRNLAIYTVGCKRVEAPESAIECEEVVEDTNMQFPFCCTRLRCLVVVRGEVWTRVLGQPWETLPAAPWSHMYKMKKPPPGSENTFLPKIGEGPVYELQRETATEDETGNVIRTKKSKGGEALAEEYSNDVVSRPAPAAAQPDIVIALSTNLDKEPNKKEESLLVPSSAAKSMQKYPRARSSARESFFEEDAVQTHADEEVARAEDSVTHKQASDSVLASEERYFMNNVAATQKPYKTQNHQVSWTEIPQSQWNEHDPEMDMDSLGSKPEQLVLPPVTEEKKAKSGNLQALVDAIGTRMRDIESAVQRMSEKVQKAPEDNGSGEKSATNQIEPEIEGKEKMRRPSSEGDSYARRVNQIEEQRIEVANMKRPAPEGETYKRFSPRNRGSKYLHKSDDVTTEPPLFIEDTHNNGYFSDASNSVLKRAMPMEPPETYMAPVMNLSSRRKTPPPGTEEEGGENQKPHKKRIHKKKHAKVHHKKRHPKDEKPKKYRLNSGELYKNAVSLEEVDLNNNNNNQ